MKIAKLLPSCRGLAALALSLTALAGTVSAGDGQLRYDVHQSNAGNAKKTQSNASLNLSAGEVRHWTKNHVRNPQNGGRNDLVLTVRGAFGSGENTFWLVKDGSQTLSFPPYLPGADLDVIRVECKQVATIEDSRMLWDALGGGPSELLAKLQGAARSGAEEALATLAASTETALAGLDQASLEAQRALLVELRTRAQQLDEGTSDVLEELDAILAEDLPELHEALVATAQLRPDPSATAGHVSRELQALLAQLQRSAGFDPSGFGRIELPCEVDVEVVARFELSLNELQTELEGLTGGELVPAELLQLLEELDAACRCASGADGISRALRGDLAALSAYLERVSSELEQLDTRVLKDGGKKVQKRIEKLVAATARLKREVDTLSRLQEEVDGAEADFETSYARIKNESGLSEILAEISSSALPSIPLASLDREQAQKDLEIHARSTKRYAQAIEKRDAQWDAIGRSAQSWSKHAGALTSSIGKLRVDARGLRDLTQTLQSMPALQAPDGAARTVSECVAAAQRSATAALRLVDRIARGGADAVLPPELRPRAQAVLGAMEQLSGETRESARAAAEATAARLRAGATVLRLAAAVANPKTDGYASQVERRAREVAREGRAVVAAQQTLRRSLQSARRARAALIDEAQSLLHGLQRINGKRRKALARVASAASRVVQVEVKLRGLDESLADCSAALEEFLQRIENGLAGLTAPAGLAGHGEDSTRELIAALERLNEAHRRFEGALATACGTSTKAISSQAAAAGFEELVAAFLSGRIAAPRNEAHALFRTAQEALQAFQACASAGLFGSGRSTRAGSFPDVVRTKSGPVTIPVPYPNVDASTLQGELQKLDRLARLWIRAFERTPGRLAEKAAELSPVPASSRAEIAAHLTQLQDLVLNLSACADQAWTQRSGLTSAGRVDAAVAQVAKLPSGAASILSDLQALFSPAGDWSFASIEQKIGKGTQLLNELADMPQTAATSLVLDAAPDVSDFQSSIACAQDALGELQKQAAGLDALLDSLENAGRRGVARGEPRQRAARRPMIRR